MVQQLRVFVSLAKNLCSGPSIHCRQFTTTCNSSIWGNLLSLTSEATALKYPPPQNISIYTIHSLKKSLGKKSKLHTFICNDTGQTERETTGRHGPQNNKIWGNIKFYTFCPEHQSSPNSHSPAHGLQFNSQGLSLSGSLHLLLVDSTFLASPASWGHLCI